jgi:L-fuconolactonase
VQAVKIDAHQHFWNPARGDYDWMPKDNQTLWRVYGPKDLAPILDRHGIDTTILVQAAATVDETEYLLGLADGSDRIAGVVGWVDFEQPAHMRHLERLAHHAKFKGVRPMIQDIPDVDWMLQDHIQWGYAAIAELGLTFDALGLPRHLDNFLILFDRHPDMKVVIDHCMKPDIAHHTETAFAHWAHRMTRIASETPAFCKLSGLVTEAGEDWSVDTLKPYVDHILSSFGPGRIMWGSDWPVCRLRAEYDLWWAAAQTLTDHLPQTEKDSIFGGAAVAFYGIDVDGGGNRT